MILDSSTFRPNQTGSLLHRLRLISPWLWANVALAALAILAQFLPLTRELHYELSAAAGLWVSLGVGLAAILSWTRRSTPGAPDDAVRSFDSPTGTLLPTIALALASTLPTLAVALVHNLIVGFCGLGDGLLWYVVLVPASAVISVAVARLAWTLAQRRWVQVLLFVALWSAPLLRGAFEALTGPHIFFYGWQVGFFPGGSWDPELPIAPLLLLYRFGHLLIAAALIAVLAEIARARAATDVPRHSRASDGIAPGDHRSAGAASLHVAARSIVIPAACLAAAAVALYPLRSEIGLTRTNAWLQSELGDSIVTQYATIHYNAAAVDSLDIWRAANYTDFYVGRYKRILASGESQERITFYAYSSGAEQKRLVGTSSASFTKPWLRMLHLSFDRIESTLEHELAHIVLEPFGNMLGVSWSNGVLEGAAVALERADDRDVLHRQARAAYDFGLAPPVLSIMSSTGFASKRASLSYMLAGSFCRWLIDTYGIKRFTAAYASGSLEEHYEQSAAALEAAYRRHLDSLSPTPAAFEPTVRYLYGGGSFFLQRCLRRLATLTGEGYRALGEERYDEALEHFRASLGEGISSGARAGVIRALHGAGRYEELIDSVEQYRADTASHWLLPFDIEVADALAMRGDSSTRHSSRSDARSDGLERQRLLERVVRNGGDEWTRTRAALRLLLDPPDSSGLSNEPSAIAMRHYFARPMTPIERVAYLGEVRARLDRSSRDWRDRDELLRLLQAGLIVESTPLLAIALRSADGQALESAYTHDLRVRTVADTTGRLYAFARAALLRTLIDARLLAAGLDRTGPELSRLYELYESVAKNEVITPRAEDMHGIVEIGRPSSELLQFVGHLAGTPALKLR